MSDDCHYFDTVNNPIVRNYYRCSNCDLIFCDPKVLLKAEVEKSRYAFHENHILTKGYENFLRELLDPIIEIAGKAVKGLDFGSGPYPMMVELAKSNNLTLDFYDPYFAPNDSVFKNKYGLIVCCEVVEHFNQPAKSYDQMISLLDTGGFLGIKTGLYQERENFSRWHYVQDDTHISIHTEKTMDWITRNWNLSVVYRKKNVTIFKGP